MQLFAGPIVPICIGMTKRQWDHTSLVPSSSGQDIGFSFR